MLKRVAAAVYAPLDFACSRSIDRLPQPWNNLAFASLVVAPPLAFALALFAYFVTIPDLPLYVDEWIPRPRTQAGIAFVAAFCWFQLSVGALIWAFQPVWRTRAKDERARL